MPIGLRRPRLTPESSDRLFALVLPGPSGPASRQINLLVEHLVRLAACRRGAVSYLFYADRLVQLPLGVVGVALGTALLPLLVRHVRTAPEAARAALNRGIETALLLTLPAAVGLFVRPAPSSPCCSSAAPSSPRRRAATAGALAAIAVGLPAYVLIKVLAPAFFARAGHAHADVDRHRCRPRRTSS